MGRKKYPPLKHREVIEILVALGFELDRSNKHSVYVRKDDGMRGKRVIPVDDYAEFDETLIKRMIPQTGFSREEFYRATPKTSKKI